MCFYDHFRFGINSPNQSRPQSIINLIFCQHFIPGFFRGAPETGARLFVGKTAVPQQNALVWTRRHPCFPRPGDGPRGCPPGARRGQPPAPRTPGSSRWPPTPFCFSSPSCLVRSLFPRPLPAGGTGSRPEPLMRHIIRFAGPFVKSLFAGGAANAPECPPVICPQRSGPAPSPCASRSAPCRSAHTW